jgi:hypothetical protein
MTQIERILHKFLFFLLNIDKKSVRICIIRVIRVPITLILIKNIVAFSFKSECPGNKGAKIFFHLYLFIFTP